MMKDKRAMTFIELIVISALFLFLISVCYQGMRRAPLPPKKFSKITKVEFIPGQPGGGFMGGGGVDAATIVYLEDGSVIPLDGMQRVKIGDPYPLN